VALELDERPAAAERERWIGGGDVARRPGPADSQPGHDQDSDDAREREARRRSGVSTDGGRGASAGTTDGTKRASWVEIHVTDQPDYDGMRLV
jgi:hypothetical protein